MPVNTKQHWQEHTKSDQVLFALNQMFEFGKNNVIFGYYFPKI